MKTIARLLCLLLFSAAAYAQNNAGNLSGTVLPSLARTATTVTSADQTNVQWKGGLFVFNVSAWTTGTYTPTIQGKDAASGQYYTILTGPALTATGTTVLQVYPGVVATTTSANTVIPKTWRVSIAGASTPVMTFSLGIGFVQ